MRKAKVSSRGSLDTVLLERSGQRMGYILYFGLTEIHYSAEFATIPANFAKQNR